MRRQPPRCVRTNSFRAARSVSSLTRAPGSPTEEIARMLETEPQNRQPDPNDSEGAGQNQSPGQEGSQRRGLLRRGRRGVTKGAGVPAFKSGAPAEGDRPASGAGQASGTGVGAAGSAVPAVPVVPAHQPAQDRSAA